MGQRRLGKAAQLYLQLNDGQYPDGVPVVSWALPSARGLPRAASCQIEWQGWVF